MQEYRSIADHERAQRRSLADAIDVVRAFAAFKELAKRPPESTVIGHIRIWPMELPSGQITAIIGVFFPSCLAMVTLPTASHFWGVQAGTTDSRELSTLKLQRSIVYADGSLSLATGELLRDVVIKRPTYLPYQPSPVDFLILWHVIAMTGSQKLCGRSIRQGVLPRSLRKGMPTTYGIDYDKVKNICRPSIKEIARHLRLKEPTLKNVSPQKIADALNVFGVGTRPGVSS